MDWLHTRGVDMVVTAQQQFKESSEQMLILSHMGDPRNAFLVYFPLTYFWHRQTGIKVMWAGAISEWLNAVLKWFLFGHRPYWWTHITSLYTDETRPSLDQYRLTCETGPGSPSGHAMVTASVWYIMVKSLLLYKNGLHGNSFLRTVSLWFMFTIMMTCISVSRCFIASHFPHQVVLGTVIGVVIGETLMRIHAESLPFRAYLLSSLVILLSSPLSYHFLEIMGYDIGWTIKYAKQWCARPEWVYLDTTPYFIVTRDSSILLGTGVAMWISKRIWKTEVASTDSDQKHSSVAASLTIALSVMISRGMEYIPLPQDNMPLFYTFAFCRYLVLPSFIIILVPFLCSIFVEDNSNKVKNR